MSTIKISARAQSHYLHGKKYHHFKKCMDYLVEQIDRKVEDNRKGPDINYWQEENELGRVWSF